MNSTTRHRCTACGAASLHDFPGFQKLPRVTSDSKPFRAGGKLCACNRCGLVQKFADERWLAEIGEIYRDYEIYHQSAANDQAVFDPVSGRPRGRCEVLAQRLLESGALPLSGALLDVGAGSGAMLAAFSSATTDWKLYGLDLDARKENSLRAIPRFERLFTVPTEKVSRQFDLITLVHSLEHFPDPLSMLRALRGRIASGGKLFVQVNNIDKAPFDLVVADHLCHFSPRSLGGLVALAGLAIESSRVDWIYKEISLVASAHARSPAAAREDPEQVIPRIQGEIAWLESMLEHARRLANGGGIGIFGTSVAATWLAAGLGSAVEFFVDEDPAREGRMHLGRPILKPADVAPGAVVYLAFVSEVASAIQRRLSALPVRFESLSATSAQERVAGERP
jgi:SAM-dependent methyltransferase